MQHTIQGCNIGEEKMETPELYFVRKRKELSEANDLSGEDFLSPANL